jgi:hypothetical protein
MMRARRLPEGAAVAAPSGNPKGLSSADKDGRLGTMAEWPTREQIYARVDELFRMEYPDAPAQLSATDPGHANWREAWLRYRDVVVNDVVDRAYWDEHPDAPVQIDPNNPDHQRYQATWLALRELILSNTPEPPLEAGEVSASDLRNNCLELISYSWDQIRTELHSDIRATVETMIDSYLTAVRDGTAPDQWLSERVVLTSNEDPEHKVHLQVRAFHYQGRHTGGLEDFKVDKPLTT